jgi:hypothetical protein
MIYLYHIFSYTPNLFLCSKSLYQYSFINYITKGKIINSNLPIMLFMIPIHCISKVELYLMISHDTMEYVIITIDQILPFLQFMNGKWKKVFVYAYTHPILLAYYDCIGYCYSGSKIKYIYVTQIY